MTSLLNQYRTEKKAEQDAIYNEAMTTVDAGLWNTTDDLEKYIRGYKDKVSDTQYAELENRLLRYRSDPEQIAKDEAFRKTYQIDEDGTVTKKTYLQTNENLSVGGVLSSSAAGNNFKILDGSGNEYDVELGKAVADNLLPSEELAALPDKTPFMYEGELYIKKGDKAYEVRGRGGSGKDSTFYQNVAALFGDSAEGVYTDDSVRVKGLAALLTGNNFKVGDFKVELGTEVKATELPSDMHGRTKVGSVFAYNGKLYYRTDGVAGPRYFEVRGRGNAETEDYKNALALFTGQ